MPIIAIANPKGGAGKSTLALVVATTLVHTGQTVAIIDADPNRTIDHWATGHSQFKPTVIANATDTSIIGMIRDAAKSHAFVIIDLEGVASVLVSRAISRADLVLIPLRGSSIDARQAARAVQLIRDEEESYGRKIPFSIVMTCTSPLISTRIEKEIVAEIKAAGFPVAINHLYDRAAFRAMFRLQQALPELDPAQVNGLEAASRNALHLVGEIAQLLIQREAA